MKPILLIYLFTAFTLLSCDEFSLDPKHELAIRISSESCEVISEMATSTGLGLIAGISNGVLGSNSEEGNANLIPDSWCECFTEFISKDMEAKLTYEEMVAVAADQMKLVMYLSKAIPLWQVEIQKCIEGNVQEGIKDYVEFQNELNQKFQSHEE
jgi:hypothetical protein